MLIEKYLTVQTELEDEHGSSEIYTEEVYVSNNDIKHYIDTYLSAEDVLNYAKQIAPEYFEDNNADLDLAYEILIEEFDEHDDIADIEDLNNYIQDCVQQDYEDEVRDMIITDNQDYKTDEMEYRDHMSNLI